MLIYFSQNKAENLLKETEIKASVFESIFRLGLDRFQIGGTTGSISATMEFSNEKNRTTKEIKPILKSLKSKGKLVELSPNTPIRQFAYISSSGTLEYIKFENGFTASRLSKDDLDRVRRDGEFFDDDILYFQIRICHEQYDKITVKCTAANIGVFGGANLSFYYPDLFKDNLTWMRHPHSGDPGILHRKIEVEFIVWILDTNQNERNIIGSPIVIYC